MSLIPINGCSVTVPQKAKTAMPNMGENSVDKSRFPIRQLDYGQDLGHETYPEIVDDKADFEVTVSERINLPFAIQQLDKMTSLVLLPLSIHLPGDEVIQEMNNMWRNISVARPFLQKTMNLLSSVVVGTAIVHQVSHSEHENSRLNITDLYWVKVFVHDHELCNGIAMCHIDNFEPNTLLSHLFHNPRYLRNRSDFVVNDDLFYTYGAGLDNSMINKKVIVLRIEVNAFRLTLVVSALITLSIIVGIAFGACTQSVEGGLALAGVLVTLVCGLLPITVWFNSAF
jgi:hypothetical protein